MGEIKNKVELPFEEVMDVIRGRLQPMMGGEEGENEPIGEEDILK